MNKNQIIEDIKQNYPNPKCELNFKNNYELVCAVILSAQCTDRRVNQVTPTLFKKYPTIYDLAKANQKDIEKIIYTCGFYSTKSKNLILMACDVVKRFNGEIPNNKKDLKSLAGVGEKTANVVLAEGFKIPAIAVDTHVFRVSNRLGLANSSNVEGTQRQLEKCISKSDWIQLHYALVLHGRYICKAIKPDCENCKLSKNCKFYNKNMKNNIKIVKK